MKKIQSIASALVAIIMLISMTSCDSATPVESSLDYHVPSESSHSTVQNTPEPTPAPTPQLTEFEIKVQAEQNTRLLSFEKLFRNPYNYTDGTLYRIGGQITYIDRSQTETTAYIDVWDGVIKFIYPGWIDALDGDIIVFWGTFTDLSWDDYVVFEVDNYELFGRYILKTFPDEIWSFLIGTYELTYPHGMDWEDTIELTNSSMGGRLYTIKEYYRIDGENGSLNNAAEDYENYRCGSYGELYMLKITFQDDDTDYYLTFDYLGNMHLSDVKHQKKTYEFKKSSSSISSDHQSSNPSSTSTNNDFVFSDSDTELIADWQAENLSDSDLVYAINEIYARHGYIFKNDELRTHFEQFDWYEGTIASENFSSSLFNNIEQQNLNLLVSERNSRK